MCFMKMPKPVKAPPPPSQMQAEMEDLRERRRMVAANQASGRRSTLLTGGRGVDTPAPVFRKTTLGQ